MKSAPRPNLAATSRQPKTQRGWVTHKEIVTTARDLLGERWVDEIPFTELAEAAGVARASLLHAFPNWRHMLWYLFEQESDHLAKSYAAASVRRRARPTDRVYAMLATLLDRAEITGRLYPNLRGAMFTWDGIPTSEDLAAISPELPLGRNVARTFVHIRLNEYYIAVEELIGIPRDQSLLPIGVRRLPIGECLVNFAFDLAAGSPTLFATFDDRRRTLKSMINMIAAGMRPSKPRVAKKRRR